MGVGRKGSGVEVYSSIKNDKVFFKKKSLTVLGYKLKPGVYDIQNYNKKSQALFRKMSFLIKQELNFQNTIYYQSPKTKTANSVDNQITLGARQSYKKKGF